MLNKRPVGLSSRRRTRLKAFVLERLPLNGERRIAENNVELNIERGLRERVAFGDFEPLDSVCGHILAREFRAFRHDLLTVQFNVTVFVVGVE